MEFYIGKNSSLPVLKMQIVKDGRVDYESFNNLIEKSSIYFSMVDTKTGRVKINLASASFVNKIFDDPNTPPEYYIYYKFSKKDTNKIGRYEGQFLLKNEEGTLILPIRESLFINVVDSNISDTEQETNILTLESFYSPGSITAQYTLTLKYPVNSDVFFSFQNILYVIEGDPIIINETIVIPARQISTTLSVTIDGDFFNLTRISEFKNVTYNLNFSTPFKYEINSSYRFDQVTRTPTPTSTITPTPTPSITGTITPTPSFTPTNTITPTITKTQELTPSITPSSTVTPTPTETPVSTQNPRPNPSPTPTPTETIITLIDPILVGQTNEFISVGDGFYLKYVDLQEIISDAILVDDGLLFINENQYLKYIDP